jgi:DNA modification methylase
VEALTDAADEDLDELLAELRVENGVGPTYEYDPEHNVYFEDCVEGMRERLEEDSIDFVLTDPPYGIGVVQGDKVVGAENEAERKDYAKFEGDDEFDFRPCWERLQRVADTFVVWGGNYFTDVLPPTTSWLIWDKRAGDHHYLSDVELAWTNLGIPAKVYDYTWQGMIREGGEGDRHHPTQKPVGLFTQIIEDYTEPGDTILDPYMGSGTTAVAAIQTGRDYVGFELDEENYRSVIERRIGEAKRQREASVNQDD